LRNSPQTIIIVIARFVKEERDLEVTKEDLKNSSSHLNDAETAVEIIDQTKLPNREVYMDLTKKEEMYDAIKTLAVRGAPAIGIFAGYSMYVLALGKKNEDKETFINEMRTDGEYLISSRPTAVNLSWAVKRQLSLIEKNRDKSVAELVTLLHDESIAIHKEDIEMCYRIGEYGLTLVKPGDGILTHCNAGPLATSKYGTATAPVFLGKERGIDFHVFSDETRPLLQGARLTSYELQKAGIDVTLICDNMASIVMKQGKVQAVFVGCDRIAANGDFANKIGTSGVAILAKYYGIPFYTLGPRSTIDMNCPTGDDIVIEQRNPDEIKTMWYKEPMALNEVKCYNPSFDVTDHSLVTAIVTDKGIVRPPFDVNLKKIMSEV
jgi:methylthioribose-1-phosphate isomerase